MKKWKVYLVIILILTFFIIDNYSKKSKDEKCSLSVTGKIYVADIEPVNLSKYYGYKFFYNKKLYKSTHFIENKNFSESGELNESLVGRCFEVKINPEEPETCKLILKNEIDCDSFLDNR